jgi:hypothetical protein
VTDDRIAGIPQPYGSRMTPAERREDIISTPPPWKGRIPLTEETPRSVFLAWEKLRLVFNAALAIVVLLSAGSALSEGAFWRFLVGGVLGANVCFCLGPVVEGYLSLLGSDRQAARWVVFSLGMMAGCLLAFLAVFSWHMRGID